MNKTLKELLRKIDAKEARYSHVMLLVRRDEFRGRVMIAKSEKTIKELRSKQS